MRSVFVGQNVRQNVLLFGRMFLECSSFFGVFQPIRDERYRPITGGLLAVFCPPPQLNIMVSTDLNPLLIYPKQQKRRVSPTSTFWYYPSQNPPKTDFRVLFYSMRDYWRYFASPWNNGTLQTRWTCPCEHFFKPNFNPSVCRIVWIVSLYLVSKNRRREIDILIYFI